MNGRIPNYAKSSNGELNATLFYYLNMKDKHILILGGE
jgi:hypothetical protein